MDKVFSVITEPNGRIIGFENYRDDFFTVSLKKGNDIDDLIPAFYGLFPVVKSELILQNITIDNFKGNIILNNNLHEVKIQFFEWPERMSYWEQIMQEYNQQKLINKLVMKTDEKQLSCNVLYTLGFMTFEKTDQGFILSGNIPKWFKCLFPSHNYSSLVFNLEELFPFLEVFMPEAYHIFKSKEEGKLVSGLWTEYGVDNKEVVLQATAVKESGRDYVFIESVSERFPDKQKNMQKSRETFLAHQQLKKTEEALRELFKHREQFISIFSHDVKGPLGGAFSLIELLKKDEDFMSSFSDKHAHIFNVIHKDLRDLHDYSNKLYDWSNLNFGNIALDISRVHILDLVLSLKTSFLEKIKEKKIDLVVDIDKDIIINVDQVFFKNALYNVIANAIKFSYRFGKIEITSEESDTEIAIIISDEGVGISDEMKNTLLDYDKKYSCPGTNGEVGTGIGFNIVKRIVDMHGAEMNIESEVNKGTSIRIAFKKEY